MTADKLLTTPETADLLRTSPRTLEDWRRKGFGPRTQPIGSRVFYRESDVTAWLDDQREQAAS